MMTNDKWQEQPVEQWKKKQIQEAINAAKYVLVRLRAMKKSGNHRELEQWRKAVALDLNDLNYKTQTL